MPKEYTFEDYKCFEYISKTLNNFILDDKTIKDIVAFNKHLPAPVINTSVHEIEQPEYFAREIISGISGVAEKINEVNPSILETNIKYLADLLSLTTHESEIFGLMIRLARDNIYTSFLNAFGLDAHNNNIKCRIKVIQYALELSQIAIEDIISPFGNLSAYGLQGQRGFAGISKFTYSIHKSYKNGNEFIQDILGKPLKATLSVGDFQKLPEIALALKIIKNTAYKGINILIYGEPGNGKTEFAKTLADYAGLNLYSVAEENGDLEKTQNYRFSEMRLIQKLVHNNKTACLLFDEAEDIFRRPSPNNIAKTNANKIEINRMLENNICPVIWTTNDIEDMDEAYIRRFTIAIYMPPPSAAERENVWQKIFKENGLMVENKDALELAKSFNIPFSMITDAAKISKTVGYSLETVKTHIRIMQKAMNKGVSDGYNYFCDKVNFNMELINADTDLKMLENLNRLDFSLLIYGAPGTGKSTYVQHLAQMLNITINNIAPINFITPYIWETKKNVRKIFERARYEKSLLFFDDTDLLFIENNKLGITELTAKHEIIRLMQFHATPFVCVANLKQNIDFSSLKYFNFKVKFSYLDDYGIKKAWEYFFKIGDIPTNMPSLNKIVPADFITVKKKAEMTGEMQNSDLIIKMLQSEQNFKTYGSINKIGFIQ